MKHYLGGGRGPRLGVADEAGDVDGALVLPLAALLQPEIIQFIEGIYLRYIFQRARTTQVRTIETILGEAIGVSVELVI